MPSLFRLADTAILALSRLPTFQPVAKGRLLQGDGPCPHPHMVFSVAENDVPRAMVALTLAPPGGGPGGGGRAQGPVSFVLQGQTAFSMDLPDDLDALPMADPGALFDGVDLEGQELIMRRLLDAVPRHLRVPPKDAVFSRALQDLAADLTARWREEPGRVRRATALALDDGLTLAVGRWTDPLIGDTAVLHRVGRDVQGRNPFPPCRLPVAAERDRPMSLILVETSRRPSADTTAAPAATAATPADGPPPTLVAVTGSRVTLVTLTPAADDASSLVALMRRLPLPAREAALGYLLARLGPEMRRRPRLKARMEELARILPAVPARAAHPAPGLGLGLDLAVPVPGVGLWLSGWIHDPEARIVGLSVHSPFRQRPKAAPWPPVVLNRLAPPPAKAAGDGDSPPRGRTPDTPLPPQEAEGLAMMVPGLGDPLPGFTYAVEAHLASGERMRLRVTAPAADAATLRNRVLACLPPESLTAERAETLLHPVVAALHQAALAPERVADLRDFGPPVADPAVSVVVPLYKNYDFLRPQLLSFAADPAMAGVEVIYVLDSPEDAESLAHALRGLSMVFGRPLRLVIMARNCGFGAAVNAGAAAARAPWLVLMNSDVVPAAAGWLAPLMARAKGPEAPGLVGPRMLFEDESLQHAGLFFKRDPVKGWWSNHHYFKGYPARFAPALRPRPVPGLTGGCLLVRADTFAGLGGLNLDYVVGDYEDSDFCLRLRAEGLEPWYEPASLLYHFERQSIEAHAGYARTGACEYNRWLHHKRWDTTIEALQAAMAPVDARVLDEALSLDPPPACGADQGLPAA